MRSQTTQIEDVAQLVGAWGLELWPDEAVRDDGLCFAEVDGELGYVLVTSTRLRFLVPKRGIGRGRTPPEVRINRELRLLRAVTTQRRRLRRVVVLRFDDAELVAHVETGPQDRLVELLQPA